MSDNGQIRGYRVLIGIPCHDTIRAETAASLAKLVGYTAAMHLEVVPGMTIHMEDGSVLVTQRRKIALTAMEYDYTHILWIDSDQTFPATTLMQLLVHNKPIVAANYVSRRTPARPVALNGFGPYDEEKGYRPNHVWTNEDSSGLEEVQSVGMGAMLTQIEVFRRTPEPWFTFDWMKTGYEGEDIAFCRAAREAGFPTLIDHDLSKQVGHIGSLTFKHEHARGTREMWDEDYEPVGNRVLEGDTS